MRTIPEFAAACREHDRHIWRLIVGMLVWAALGLVAVGTFFDRLALTLVGQLGTPGGEVAALALFLVALFAPVLVFAGWVERRVKQIPGANCPACGKAVIGLAARQYAAGTRCCPHCHARLLADPDPAPDVLLRPLAEVEAADRVGGRRAAGWLAGTFVVLFAGTAAYALLAELVGGDRKEGLFAKAADDPYTAALLDLAAFLLLGFVPCLVALARFVVIYRRAERQPAVRCPRCGGRLLVGLLRKTGNCGHCGRLAVLRPGESGTMAADHPGTG
jgi:hypothetical protein